MILGFDVGNTSTTGGIYAEHGSGPDFTYRFSTEKDTDPKRLGRQVGDGIAKGGETTGGLTFAGLAFSSVVPEINAAYHTMARERFGLTAYEITCRSRLNFKINYNDPEELGVDRIVNAAAAFEEYGGGCIVVDIGTAVTFCVLLENRIFDGGIIAPGVSTAIRSLSGRASRLPEVPFEKPDRLAARDTVNALKSGFFYGWLSLADGIIGRIEAEYGRRFRVILTGGFAGAVTEHLVHENTVDPLLAMKGIKYIYDMNR
ncbi:MAG: type III pantothenate kinase [Spirochaetes bacterium]|nr:type III pantothenate kinase [Spirochaetota bacterium]